MPCEQTPRQPTPGSSGTQRLQDLFRETFQQNEPPIQGPSQASDSQLLSHENSFTGETEFEVAPTQSSEEPFGKYFVFFVFFCYQLTLTPPFTVISLSFHSPLFHHHRQYAHENPPSPLVPSSPHSNNEALQKLINLRPMLMIPQAIVQESINQIFLKHCQLLHMIPFVDSTH
ncbi:hypothetical protein O181_014445 [Austropuccinia psidii MF-1]|uniref:Uncharacterized protein n=1 Tax=Austropuccinia psidii MF-1 TaxID=1389203 RepID=A0A9Q3GPX5_9BASI|nr:hypothetical protein [Austropuccinia psidii MF-1]